MIGDDCIVEDGVVIRNSIIWSKSRIGRYAELSSCVLGNQTYVGDYARIEDNVFLGDKCLVGKESRLASNIKLWPEKVVEEGAYLHGASCGRTSGFASFSAIPALRVCQTSK